jgi:hypothetical protein
VFLDATYGKVRVNQRVVSQAVVIATGQCRRQEEVLGCATGDSETEPIWTEFLRDRGLICVRLGISDAYRGLTNAIAGALQGASWQRGRLYFMRSKLAKVSKGHAEMVAASIRTIFAQPWVWSPDLAAPRLFFTNVGPTRVVIALLGGVSVSSRMSGLPGMQSARRLNCRVHPASDPIVLHKPPA